MSKITRIINEAKEFSRTPAGQVAVSGLGYVATMTLCGGIVAKFLPGKATFGRALGMGIYATAMQTIVGAAMTAEQQQRADWMGESHETYRKEMREELIRLRSEMYRLQEQLSEKDSELEDATARIRHAKADMDGTMKHVYDLRDENAELCSDLEEVRKERNCLLATEKELVRQRDELKARKDGAVYPRRSKGDTRLESPPRLMPCLGCF